MLPNARGVDLLPCVAFRWSTELIFSSFCLPSPAPHATSLLSNAVIATQFLTEGVAVLVLFSSDEELTPEYLHAYSTDLQSAGFYMTLLSIFYPIFQKGYDGIFVQIITNCIRKKFDFVAACALVSGLILAIPATIGKLCGGGSSGTMMAAKTGGAMKALSADVVTVKKGKQTAAHAALERSNTKRMSAREKADAGGDGVGDGGGGDGDGDGGGDGGGGDGGGGDGGD